MLSLEGVNGTLPDEATCFIRADALTSQSPPAGSYGGSYELPGATSQEIEEPPSVGAAFCGIPGGSGMRLLAFNLMMAASVIPSCSSYGRSASSRSRRSTQPPECRARGRPARSPTKRNDYAGLPVVRCLGDNGQWVMYCLSVVGAISHV